MSRWPRQRALTLLLLALPPTSLVLAGQEQPWPYRGFKGVGVWTMHADPYAFGPYVAGRVRPRALWGLASISTMLAAAGSSGAKTVLRSAATGAATGTVPASPGS